MIGDGLRYAAQTLHHELIHATDACKRRKQTSCGEFTTAALNAGKFDDKICTEIHAYAQQNAGVTYNGLGKNDVIRRAVDSVLDGCEFYKAKPSEIDENFLEELTKKVEGMYEKCKGKGWEAVQ